MKSIILLLFCLFYLGSFSQTIQVLKPVNVNPLNFSPELIKDSKEIFTKCDKIYEKLKKKGYKATHEEEKILERCDEMNESPWDVIGIGCSWYCLGGGDSVTASSQLKNQGKNNYDPSNAHDLSYETAWVEGVEGNGIGEYLLYHFRPNYPTGFHTVIVANGYVKSEEAWTNNSRIKKLKMYVNGKPYAILELKDSRSEQSFKTGLIQFSKTGGTVKFEIMEVYQGKKYNDAVITEIYFDGPSH